MSQHACETVSDRFASYYAEEDVHQVSWSFREKLAADPEIQVEETLAHQPQRQYHHKGSSHPKHEEMVDRLLGEAVDDAEQAEILFTDDFADCSEQLYEMLRSHGTDPTSRQGYNTVFEDVSTLIFEEVPYDSVSEHGYTDIDSLQERGELDIGIFELCDSQPSATYTEVKSGSSRGVVSDAKDQLDRFSAYANSFGWDVDREIAVFDDEESAIHRCTYQPDEVK